MFSETLLLGSYVICVLFAHETRTIAQTLRASQIILMARGQCASVSHTTECSEGADLSKSRIPFNCDSVVIADFVHDSKWPLIQFTEKESITENFFGFSGELDKTGTHLTVSHVYFENSAPLDADARMCNFIFDGTNLSQLSCVGKVDQDNRRAVALVEFNFFPGQTAPQ